MSRLGLAATVFVQFVSLALVCVLVGDNGWDDGAITLAFSRTFASHGSIALTPRSEVVEGFSSVSWFLLNALAAWANPSYHALILFSQLAASLCICAATLLLGRTCILLGMDRRFSTLTVVGFAAWGCSFHEAANGMEMGLLAIAVLLIVNETLSPRPRGIWLGLGAVLAVATRFEAVLYVALLAGSAFRMRRVFWTLFLACLATVIALTLWRLSVFSDLLPNTYWAKRFPPYAALDVKGRLLGAVELLAFFLVPTVAFALMPRFGFDLVGTLRTHRRALLVLGAPILGALCMGVLTGEHWGYSGRMPYFAFPPALALMSLLLSDWVRARPSRARRTVSVLVGLATVAVSMKSFPTGPLGAALGRDSFGVTPRTYAETGAAIRRLAAAAELQHASVLSPDIGGLALAHADFRVIDLAMLSNRRLAHEGPRALGSVLESEAPDVIEAHWQWAAAGGLYELPFFRDHYLPAFAGGTKLWIRKEVGESIFSKGRGCWLPVDRDPLHAALASHRYAGHDLPDDRRAFERPGIVLVLNQADVARANLCK